MAQQIVVRELITRLGFKVDEGGLRRAEKRIANAARNFQRVGRNMTLFVTAPIALMAKGLIGAAAEVEILDKSLEALVGNKDKAKELRKELFQLALESPLLDVREIGQVAKKLLAFQVPLNELVNTTRLLGNISAATGAPIGRIAKAYGDVVSKGRLQSFEVRQFAENGVNLLEALVRVGVGKSTAVIEQMITNREVSAKMVKQALNELAGAGSRFEKLQRDVAKTTTGRFRKLMEQLFLLRAEIGTKLLPIVNRFMVFITRLAERFRGLSSDVQRFILIMGAVIAAIGPILLGLFILLKILNPVALAFAILAVAVGAIIDDFVIWKNEGNSLLGEILGDYDSFAKGSKKVWTSIVGTIEESTKRILVLLAGLVLATQNFALGGLFSEEGRRRIVKGLSGAASAFGVSIPAIPAGPVKGPGGIAGATTSERDLIASGLAFIQGKGDLGSFITAIGGTIGSNIKGGDKGVQTGGDATSRFLERIIDKGVNRSATQRIFNDSGAKNINITVNGAGDPKAVANEVKNSLSRELISNTDNPELVR